MCRPDKKRYIFINAIPLSGKEGIGGPGSTSYQPTLRNAYLVHQRRRTVPPLIRPHRGFEGGGGAGAIVQSVEGDVSAS